MSEFDDISGKGREKLTPEKLQAYLEGRLSPAEQYEVELWLAEEGMESDALEGLKDLTPVEAASSVTKINHQLHKKLHNRKRERSHHPRDNKWGLVAVIVVLLICVLAYFLLHLLVKVK